MSADSIRELIRRWSAAHPRLARPLHLLKHAIAVSWALLMFPVYVLEFLYFYAWVSRVGRQRIPAQSPLVESPKIVMLVWSYLPADPRVEREARALAKNGYQVVILCPHWYPPSDPPKWGPNVEIKLLPRESAHSLFVFPWLFSKAMLNAALAENAWIYHSHDLNTSLTALAAAAMKNVLCVCDFHEWYSENVTYDSKSQSYRPHSWIKKYLYRLIEKLALRSSSRIVTVCDSIARELELVVSDIKTVAVVRNIPPISPLSSSMAPSINLRESLAIPAEKAIVLYQGGVGPSRGLEPLIEAMGMVQHAVLVIRGPFIELFEKEYLSRAAKAGADGRIFCVHPVPSDRCVAEAIAADIGFWTLMPLCKNFTYALPNKVFEYLAAGLPIACARHPEVAKIVSGYDIGSCFDPEDPRSIAGAIELLASNVEFRRKCQTNIRFALADLQADREWDKLVAVYQDLTLTVEEARPRRLASAA